LEPLKEETQIGQCWVKFPLASLNEEKILEFLRILSEHLGPVPVGVVVSDGEREIKVLAGPRYGVLPTPELGEALRRLGGEMILE
jgi:hypothetical protein